MRLISFIADGRASFGVLRGDDFVADLGNDWPSLKAALSEIGAVERAAQRALIIPLADVQLRIPVPDAEKIICAGLNYRFHVAETAMKVPEFPSIFLRSHNSFVAHGEAILKPVASDAFDFEAELAFVIGKQGRNISRQDAMSYVAGYTLLADHSVRDVQMAHSLAAGKNFFRSGAIGPWIVPASEVPDPGKLEVIGRLNGVDVQRASVSELIFDIPELVSYISGFTELQPGDIVATGTPSGVGFSRKPPLYMRDGDVFEIEVPGVGILRNVVTQDTLG